MELGNQIHELRKKQGLSQEQLAERVGVARQTISKWELGETAPDIKQTFLLSQTFGVSLDALLGNETKAVVNTVADPQKKKSPWRKIVVISAIFICLCCVIAGIYILGQRSQILYPQGTDNGIAIALKGAIRIKVGSGGAVVLNENNKPKIACKLPERFIADGQRVGFYADEAGNFIQFDGDYAENVANPLLGTEYYSYYKDYGYQSYMDMARLAMCFDLSKVSAFSSREQIHLAGGARLLREKFCAGQNADYYEIDSELTANENKMSLYGFALHFADTTWLISLKDYNDSWFFITVKDPDGVGESSNTIKDFLNSLSVSEILINITDTQAIQEARNAVVQYIVEHAAEEKLPKYYLYQVDNSRFVAFCDGAETGIFASAEDALKAMMDNPDISKLLETEVEKLWAYKDS